MLKEYGQTAMELSPYQSLYDMIIPPNHILRRLKDNNLISLMIVIQFVLSGMKIPTLPTRWVSFPFYVESCRTILFLFDKIRETLTQQIW